MTSGILDVVKQVALGMIENLKPADLCFGLVVNTSPLSIKVNNQLEVPEMALVIPRHLTDYETELSFDDPDVLQVFTTWNMEEEPESESEPAKISFKQKIKHRITIYNALKVGEKVALLSQQGGQTYYVLDRIQ